MNEQEKRLVVIVLGAGVLAVSVLFLMILRLTAEPAQPTTSVEQVLTALHGTTQAAAAYVTVESLPATGTPPAGPTPVPIKALPSPAITDTPVLAVSADTATPTAAPTQVPTYVVQSGDTLFVLAFRFGVSVDALKGANGLTDNIIYTGQELVIPVPGLVIAPPSARPALTQPPGATTAPSEGSPFGAPAIPGPSPTWSVQAFPTRFPASGPTKLGFHVTLNSGGVLDYVAAVRPPVMKGVDDVGYLRDVKALSPTTTTIGRFVVLQENIGQGDPAQRALDFVNEMLPRYQANPWVDYWEGWNEVTYPNYEWYAVFEATRACEMHRLGFKAAIGGFSTGTPEPWQFEAFIPAIEAGIRCGAILTTHEYGAPTLYLWWSQGLPSSFGNDPVPAYPDRGPLMGRYRFLYYNMLLPRGLGIPLVISETGIDGGAGAGQRPGYSTAQGWQGFAEYWGKDLGQNDPIQFYVDQLAWYDSMLRQDSFVIGATIFNVGNSATWASFEAAPIVPRLTQYALTLN
jgi:LysM repeat protein